MKAWRALGLLGFAIACSSSTAEPGGGGQAGEGAENASAGTATAGGSTSGHAGSGGDTNPPPAGGGGDGVNGGEGGVTVGGGTGGTTSGSGGTAGSGGTSGDVGGAGGEGGGAGDSTEPGIPPRRTWDGTLPAGVCSIHGWCWYDPLPFGNPVLDVWGTSSTNVWAIGRAGTVAHFDGQSWSGITGVGESPNDPDTYNDPEFGASWSRVHGSSATDVWIVGNDKQVLHWNGTKLVASDYAGSITPRAVWAGTAQSVWMAGDAGGVSHFNGTNWQSSATGTTQNLKAVWGFSESDVWIAGGKIVKQWTGTEWQDRSTGLPGTANIVGLWGATSGELFAVGPGIYRYFGGSWTTLDPGPTSNGNLYPYVDVAGTSSMDVVFRGTYNFDMRWNGSSLETFYDDGCSGPNAVWCFEARADSPTPWLPDCLFGSTGTLPFSSISDACVLQPGTSFDRLGVTDAVSPSVLYAAPQKGPLRRLVGRTETDVDTKTTNIWDVFGLSESDVWVSADSGMTSHYDGATWTPYPVGSGARIGVRTNAAGEALTAVNGTLYTFGSGAWNAGKTFAKNVVALAVGDSTAWAMLVDGSVWERGRSDWASILAGDSNSYDTLELGVDGRNRLWRASTILGGSEKTTVSYYEGGSWHPSLTVPYAHLGVRGNEVWLFSQTGRTDRFDGTAWSTYRRGTDGVFDNFTIAGPGDVWGWGESGLVHYTD